MLQVNVDEANADLSFFQKGDVDMVKYVYSKKLDTTNTKAIIPSLLDDMRRKEVTGVIFQMVWDADKAKDTDLSNVFIGGACAMIESCMNYHIPMVIAHAFTSPFWTSPVGRRLTLHPNVKMVDARGCRFSGANIDEVLFSDLSHPRLNALPNREWATRVSVACADVLTQSVYRQKTWHHDSAVADLFGT